MEKELTNEQVEYLSSFKEAMRAIDEKIKKAKKAPSAYRRLVTEGYWRPDIIAFEFALCSKGVCGLPRALREYIIQVAGLAEQIHTKAQKLKKEKEA